MWLLSSCAPSQGQCCSCVSRRDGVLSLRCRVGGLARVCTQSARGPRLRVAAQAEFKQEQVAGAAAAKSAPANVPVEHTPAVGGAALAALGGHPEEEAGQGEEALDEKDAVALEALRNDIFMRGAIPWCAALWLPWPRCVCVGSAWCCLALAEGVAASCCNVWCTCPAWLHGVMWCVCVPLQRNSTARLVVQVGCHVRLRRVCGAGRGLHPAAVHANQMVHGAGRVCACAHVLCG